MNFFDMVVSNVCVERSWNLFVKFCCEGGDFYYNGRFWYERMVDFLLLVILVN